MNTQTSKLVGSFAVRLANMSSNHSATELQEIVAARQKLESQQQENKAVQNVCRHLWRLSI